MSVDRKPGLKRGLGLVALGLGVLGLAFAPEFLKPAPAEVAVAQTSKDSVTVTTEKPVIYQDRRLQEVLDQIKKECEGKLTVEVAPDDYVKALIINTKPNCVASLNGITIGIRR